LSSIYALLSDVSSNVDGLSGLMSDVQSAIAAGVTIGASSLSDISSRVNAEILNVMNSDVFGEPTGAPAASETINGKVGRIYQVLRNGLTITASTKAFLADDGSVLWTKDLSDDNTTYTEDEGS
jgi:hypothetical protein